MDLLHFAQALSSKFLELPCSNSKCDVQISVQLSKFLTADNIVKVPVICVICHEQTLLTTFTSTSRLDPSSTSYMQRVREIHDSSTSSNAFARYSSNWNKTTDTVATTRSAWYSEWDGDGSNDDNEESEDDGQWSMSLNPPNQCSRPQSTTEPDMVPLKKTPSEFSLMLRGMGDDSEKRISRPSSIVLSRISLSTTQSQPGTRKSIDSFGAGRNVPEGSRAKRVARDEAERKLMGTESTETICSTPAVESIRDALRDMGESSSSNGKLSEKQRGKSPAVVSSHRKGHNMHRVAISKRHNLRQSQDGNSPAVTRSNSLTDASPERLMSRGNSLSNSIRFNPSVEVLEPDNCRIQLQEVVTEVPVVSNFSRPIRSPVLEEDDAQMPFHESNNMDGASIQTQSWEDGVDATASRRLAEKETTNARSLHMPKRTRVIDRLRHLPQNVIHRSSSFFHRFGRNARTPPNFIPSAYLAQPEPHQLLPTSVPAETDTDSLAAENMEFSDAINDNPVFQNIEPAPDEEGIEEIHPAAAAVATTPNLNEGEIDLTSDGFVDEIREFRQGLNEAAYQRWNNGENPMMFSITLTI